MWWGAQKSHTGEQMKGCSDGFFISLDCKMMASSCQNCIYEWCCFFFYDDDDDDMCNNVKEQNSRKDVYSSGMLSCWSMICMWYALHFRVVIPNSVQPVSPALHCWPHRDSSYRINSRLANRFLLSSECFVYQWFTCQLWTFSQWTKRWQELRLLHLIKHPRRFTSNLLQK